MAENGGGQHGRDQSPHFALVADSQFTGTEGLFVGVVGGVPADSGE